MKITAQKTGIKRPVLFCLLSLTAGGINGFLGTGGGILLVYMLSSLTNNEQKDNFATTLCAIIPISITSLFAYSNGGNIDTGMVKMLALPAIFGGALGALVTDKVKTKYLSIAFSLLVIYSGVRMVIR